MSSSSAPFARRCRACIYAWYVRCLMQCEIIHVHNDDGPLFYDVVCWWVFVCVCMYVYSHTSGVAWAMCVKCFVVSQSSTLVGRYICTMYLHIGITTLRHERRRRHVGGTNIYSFVTCVTRPDQSVGVVQRVPAYEFRGFVWCLRTWRWDEARPD